MLPRRIRPRTKPTHLIDGDPDSRSLERVRGSVLGVTGATGAPGRTFLAINLALSLRVAGMSVALVDADPHVGAVAVQLDLAEDRSLVYLAHESALHTVDDELVSRHLQTSFGLDVLTGRAFAGLDELVPGSLLSDVVRLLRFHYDAVVLDVGALDCLAAQSTALMCQMLVWVVVPTKLGTDLLDRTLSGPFTSPVRPRPSLAVVNRLGNTALREVDSSLRRRYGMAVAAAIPDNSRACTDAENQARPAALGGPLSRPLLRCAHVVGLALARLAEDPAHAVGDVRSQFDAQLHSEGGL